MWLPDSFCPGKGLSREERALGPILALISRMAGLLLVLVVIARVNRVSNISIRKGRKVNLDGRGV